MCTDTYLATCEDMHGDVCVSPVCWTWCSFQTMCFAYGITTEVRDTAYLMCRVHRHVSRQVCGHVDTHVDTCVDTCLDMCIDMRVDMRAGMCAPGPYPASGRAIPRTSLCHLSYSYGRFPEPACATCIRVHTSAAHARARVQKRTEDVDKRDLGWVVHDLERLRVPRLARARLHVCVCVRAWTRMRARSCGSFAVADG